MAMHEARLQYSYANKLARKYVKKAVSEGKDPYVPALDDIIDITGLNTAYLGTIDIPIYLIVGTKTSARRTSFAGNFMPLLDVDNEFCYKWSRLCEYHLSETGITDPIKVYEYKGKFYVEEGNKRVSVLKSYSAVYISGNVTRILPKENDALYNTFLDFYKLSNTYVFQFNSVDKYKNFNKILGQSKTYEWDKRFRASVIGLYFRFYEVFKNYATKDFPDYFYRWLEVEKFADARYSSDKKVKQSIENNIPYILYNVAPDPRNIKMNILALADEEDSFLYEYYSKDKTKDIDLILSCGDLKKEYLEFIVTMSNKKLVYVYGNHDNKEIDGGICAEDDLIVVNGIRILGLGGSVQYSGSKNQYTELQMKWRIFKLLPKIRRAKGIDIILTHVPPRGYGDLQDYAHQGFECFKWLLDKYKPKYLIHGHVHMNYAYNVDRVIEYKDTKIINAYKRYELKY